MKPARPIRSTEELLAHAIAIEREAAERYAELGERMHDLGNDLVAELFLRLADMEEKHQNELEARARDLELPKLAPAEYAWFGSHAPESAPHDLVLASLTPHSALQVALEAEERALAFFEAARKQATDPGVAAMATEMAAEEGVHIAWVKSALRRTPDPLLDWGQVFS
jgi:rubrerythrin